MNNNIDRKTLLPASYGEAIDLPGVPSQCCVSTVHYRPNRPEGFSATFTASTQEVYVLGPHKERPNLLTTRRLWRPSAAQENVDSSVRATREALTRIVSLVAFIPSLPALKVTKADEMPSDTDSVELSGSSSVDPLVSLIVAWEDFQSQHHIAALVISLMTALSPSYPLEAVVLSRSDVLVLPPNRGVLRLFSAADSSSPCERMKGKPQIIMMSMYPKGEGGMAGANHSEKGVLEFLAVEFTEDEPQSRDVKLRRELPLPSKPLFFSVQCIPAQRLFLPWIRAFQPNSIISCLETLKQNEHSGKEDNIRAAAGAIDGRVFLLKDSSSRMIRRVSGPVADLKLITPLRRFSDAVQSLNASDNCGEIESKSSGSNSFDTALIILDSAGKIIILRSVNTSTPILQVVSDVPHIVSMRGGVVPQEISSSNVHDLKCSSSMHPSYNELAGHLLSSGILHAAVRYHPLQLMVSTMGQEIVSIPYDVHQDRFCITDYTLCSSPVLYIGVVHYFGADAEDLLMAGTDRVLVARQGKQSLSRKAKTIFKLLSKRE